MIIIAATLTSSPRAAATAYPSLDPRSWSQASAMEHRQSRPPRLRQVLDLNYLL